MSLAERAMLVNLSMAIWTGERTDAKRAKEIAQAHGADTRMMRASRYLVDPATLAPIKSMRGLIRNTHYQITLPWDDSGNRIVATDGYFHYRERIAPMLRQLQELVDEFCDCYSSYVSTAAGLLNGLYDPAEYPKDGEIRSKFYQSLTFRPIMDAADIRVSADAATIAEMRQSMQAEQQTLIDAAVADAITRMRDAVTHCADRMRNYDGGREGSFRDSLVEGLRDLAQVIPGLNIAADPRIDEVAADIGQLARYDADDLRESDKLRETVSNEADAIAKKMESFGW